MSEEWKEKLSCATRCTRCGTGLEADALRILSVYDHEPVCMECKRQEEQRPDYAEVAKGVIGHCMAETEVLYGDPGSYCYHHFYPFKCD